MGSFFGSIFCVLLLFTVACNAEINNETIVLESPTFSPFDLGEACEAPMFQCRNNDTCIVAEAVCDGDQDCPDGDDEMDCGNRTSVATSGDKACENSHLLCNDGLSCVPKVFVCDGDMDCLDGSDEHDCQDVARWYPGRDPIWVEQTNRKLCSKDEFRCEGASGLCIPFNQTCDGKRDCPHGEDENELCNSCHKRKCSHKCHNTHTGTQCICPDGSHLGSDGSTCSDINECDTPEGKKCQHYCDNLHKNYTCRCADGYTLGSNGYSCHAEKKIDGTLIVSTMYKIGTIPMNETSGNFSVLIGINASSSFCSGLDYMHHTGTIYMNMKNYTNDHLMVFKNGTMSRLREDLDGTGSVKVDWVGGNVYFTQKYSNTSRGITVCTSDGLSCRSIISGSHELSDRCSKCRFYVDIALNPLFGTIAWIERFGHSFMIKSANMDGSNETILANSKLENLHTMAFDIIKNELYFANGLENGTIEKINMNTLERAHVVDHGMRLPQSMAVFDGSLYLSDIRTKTIKVTNLAANHTSNNSRGLLHSFHTIPASFALNHSVYQPLPAHNPCEIIKETCNFICVALSNGAGQLRPKCICPHNYVYSDEIKSCVIATAKVIYKEIPIATSTWHTPLNIILGLLLFCAVFFILYQNNSRVNKLTDSTVQQGAKGGAWICSKLQKNKPADDNYPSVSHSSIEDSLFDEITVTTTNRGSSSRDQSTSFGNPVFNDSSAANMFSL